MPSHQTIFMARFLQLVKLFYDNIWRMKDIKEINRVKRKKEKEYRDSANQRHSLKF